MKQGFPDAKMLAQLRARYPQGTHVELVKMDDPYSILRPGDRGTVQVVDDAGGIHINWSNGSTLAAIAGVDIIRKVEP